MFEFDRCGLRSRVASCLSEGSRVVAKGSFTRGYRQVNGFLVLNDFDTLYLLEKSTIALETFKIPLSLQQVYNLKWCLMYSCFRELKRLGFSLVVNGSQLHAFKRNLNVNVQTVHARDLIQMHQDTLGKMGIVDGADISFISLDKVQDPL